MSLSSHLIPDTATLYQALDKLNKLTDNPTLFIEAGNHSLIGSLTDGDIRRAILKGISLSDSVLTCMNANFSFFSPYTVHPQELKNLRNGNKTLIPVLDSHKRLIRIVNLNKIKSFLPCDAIIMAGGKGERLMPLTDKVPKPLLKIGDKPIIEYNVDRLCDFGVDNIYISINYKGNQIEDYFIGQTPKTATIRFIHEKTALGTIGSVGMIENNEAPYLIVMNSDLLTNIDFEDMFSHFINTEADMAVAVVPYQVSVPYAIFEIDGIKISSLKEKPKFTYFSNAGIYIFKKEILDLIPKSIRYDATDLIEKLITLNRKVVHYSILGYWLDIGRHEDFEKATEDVKHIKF